MGFEFSAYVDDESIPPPRLGKTFLYGIIWNPTIWGLALTEEEEEILEPNDMGEVVVGQKKRLSAWDWLRILKNMKRALFGSRQGFGDAGTVFDHVLHISKAVEDRERDPLLLKKALEKIERHLIDHAADLPLYHYVFRDPERKDWVSSITINGIEYRIDGDLSGSYDEEEYKKGYRNKIELWSWEDSTVDRIVVEVTPQIIIDQKTYYTLTYTMAEFWEGEFRLACDFLDEAARQGKKVLWEKC